MTIRARVPYTGRCAGTLTGSVKIAIPLQLVQTPSGHRVRPRHRLFRPSQLELHRPGPARSAGSEAAAATGATPAVDGRLRVFAFGSSVVSGRTALGPAARTDGRRLRGASTISAAHPTPDRRREGRHWRGEQRRERVDTGGDPLEDLPIGQVG